MTQDEVFQELCRQLGGELKQPDVLDTRKMRARVGQWSVTLDEYESPTGHFPVVFTRLRAPLASRDGLRFALYRAGTFTGLGKLLGMQDIAVGDPEFDARFVIKGNNEAQVRALLSDPPLREQIARQPDIHLELNDSEGLLGTRFPDGVDELLFYTRGRIEDVERLKQLFALFTEVLSALCHIGSAYERDPGLEL